MVINIRECVDATLLWFLFFLPLTLAELEDLGFLADHPRPVQVIHIIQVVSWISALKHFFINEVYHYADIHGSCEVDLSMLCA